MDKFGPMRCTEPDGDIQRAADPRWRDRHHLLRNAQREALCNKIDDYRRVAIYLEIIDAGE